MHQLSPQLAPLSVPNNPHAAQSTSLVALGECLWRHCQLIVQMTRRDVVGRYQGSATVLMFLSPVFYPITAVPEGFRSYLMANRLTFIIEQARAVLILGHLPSWSGLLGYTLVALVVAWGGFAWFQKTRRGFADVL